tara:strand:- start:3606 stop:4403 length:798 start_codon:yes stop_codon:yes gene_type:complete
MRAWIKGISVIAPGIEDWAAMRETLQGTRAWQNGPLTLRPPEVLSPRERRRTSPALRLALNAAAAVCQDADVAFDALPCVFASALGDGSVSDAMMTSLTQPGKPVSPTQFHNSVHNAAAGYWSIGAGNMRSSISIAAGDASFGAGLISAMTRLSSTAPEIMFVASDMPMPDLLAKTRPIYAPMAVGLVLSHTAPARACPALEILGSSTAPESEIVDAALKPLANGSPAGRALPMLTAIASAASGSHDLIMAVGSNGFRIKVRVSL